MHSAVRHPSILAKPFKASVRDFVDWHDFAAFKDEVSKFEIVPIGDRLSVV